MELITITEICASTLAAFGIVLGMGRTFYKGYAQGKCLLPSVMVKWVNFPMAGAVAFRAATLLQAQEILWLLVAIDVLAFITLMGTALQHWGFFLRKQPHE